MYRNGFSEQGKQGERCGVGGADAPRIGVEIVDAIADTFAWTKHQSTITKGDRSAWSIHPECLATQVLQGVVVGQVYSLPILLGCVVRIIKDSQSSFEIFGVFDF